MRKLLILFLIVGYFCSGQIISENDTTILWRKDRLLEWDDFKGKGKTPKNINVLHKVAETTSLFKLVYVKDQTGVEREVFLLYFSKNDSWTITNDIKMLEHEQIHFDIMEVFARKIRKQHQQFDSLGTVELDEYDLNTERYIQESIEFNKKYDEEVLLNYAKQKVWAKLIDRKLYELKEYEFIQEQ